MLDFNIDSAILARTKLHISEYSLVSLNLRCEASFLCAIHYSIPRMPSAEQTKGVKLRLCSIQGWSYLYIFSSPPLQAHFQELCSGKSLLLSLMYIHQK